MINIDSFNKSTVRQSEIDELLQKIKSRLDSIDFTPFGIESYFVHVVLDADNDSLKLSTPMSNEKRFIHFQSIPKNVTFASSFEAKLTTIRLRLQNLPILFESEINNIIFIVDFSKQMNNADKETNNIASSNNTVKQTIKSLFKKKNETEDEESERIAKFIPIKPKYSLDKVIMSKEMREQVDDALSIIRNRKKIYDDWGFSEIDPQPKAVLNFFGPPGTGKTMCAQGIASEMGQRILCVNYAEIESKYAGESPKNLIAAFRAAQDANAVLFFDEADSFLGKRISNVQSGHDQSINSLRSQMLIQLEDFEGIVIFATNLVKNFDQAFETRILRHIKFELPNIEARESIFKGMLPSKVPTDHTFDKQDFRLLAESSEGFSGRDIRNSVLDTLSSAAKREQSIISIDDFLNAIKKRQDNYESLQEDKKKENQKLANDIKQSIIERTNQEVNEAIVGIATYAAWCNGKLATSEETLLKEFASALKVETPMGFDLTYYAPLAQIAQVFNTHEKKIKALDTAIRVTAVDGIFDAQEEKFIVKLCNVFDYSPDNIQKFVEYGKSLAQNNQEWYSITQSC